MRRLQCCSSRHFSQLIKVSHHPRIQRNAAPFKSYIKSKTSHIDSFSRGIGQKASKPGTSLSKRPEPSGSRFSLLFKPFAFSVAVSGCSFAGAAIWQYETLRSLLTRKQQEIELHYGKLGSFRQHVNHYWNGLDTGRRTVACLIAVNSAVFLLWRVAPTAVMYKWFASNPYTGARCWSMLLSTFSHHSPLHLFVNMYVLWSFAPAVTQIFGREQFLGMYLSAGVASSMASYMLKVLRPSGAPSLGASGAIYAVLGAVCTQMPDSRLQIAFIGELFPHSFTAHNAIMGLLIFDTLGILLKWKLFDHAAHLGGLLFGMWYASYGHNLVWRSREPLVKWYHELRTGTQP